MSFLDTHYPFFALVSVAIGIVAPLVLVVAGSVNYTQNPKSMGLIIFGSALIFLTTLSTHVLTFLLPSFTAMADFGKFMMVASVIGSVFYAIGLLAIGRAAFVCLAVVSEEIFPEHVSAPRGPGPYQSG